MAGQQVVSFDVSELVQFAAALKAGGQKAVAEAWKAISAWGSEYQRRVVRVTPVEHGDVRRGWVLVRDKAGGNAHEMSVTLGNVVKDIPLFLEYGTARIAKGRVKDWQPGQAPIMTWPAKLGDLPDMPKFGTAKHERWETLMEKALTTGTGEQMPMLRPIGHEIAPEVKADLLQAMRDGFEAVKNRRKDNA